MTEWGRATCNEFVYFAVHSYIFLYPVINKILHSVCCQYQCLPVCRAELQRKEGIIWAFCFVVTFFFFFECLSVCLVSEATHWRTVSSKTRGIHPNGQLLRQAGPSSVAAEPPLPEKADRQSERQVGRQANRAASAESRAEQETGALPEHSN